MHRQPEIEAVVVRGTLQGGGCLEWRPGGAATIYVGADLRCQWRVAGVSPFHWQLCWYGGQLWISDLGPRRAGAPSWSPAPLGAALRLGPAAMTLEVVPLGPGAVDPDATQLVDVGDLAALPPFAPPARGSAPRRVGSGLAPRVAAPAVTRAGSISPPPRQTSSALEEMFVVPAEQPAPPPRRPGRLSALVAGVPVRALIALAAAAGMALVVFLPESLHADRDPPPAATLPPRRPPPEVEIEVRAAQPDDERADTEAAAARDLAAGRLEDALRGYRALQRGAPEDRVFADFTEILSRRVKSRCAQGDCASRPGDEPADDQPSAAPGAPGPGATDPGGAGKGGKP